jgi:hypothetical protein
MDETTAPGSPHDLLLRLAGRVDDDLLADARELVAVGEDGHALELVTAALAADGAALPPSVRAELVSAAHAARIDLDAETALAPAASDAAAHRFSAQASDDESVAGVVRQLPHRLVDGVRLRLAWRMTPAGSAPGPLPHPVLLVETREGGRPGEVLAYQIAAALSRSGVHAAVEVLTSGKPMPAYHAAALRDSTPLDDGAPPLAPRATPSPPEVVESVVAEVVEEVSASRRAAAVRSEAPRAEPANNAPVDLFAADEEPAPRPVPMRTWPGGRRRRAFGDDPEQTEEQTVTSIARAPLPSPVPLARRTRPGPVPRPGDEFAASPFEDGPTGSSDPLVGPLDQPLVDSLLHPQPGHDESGWANEWASGDWAVGAPADDTGDTDTPVSGLAPVAPPDPAATAPASEGLLTTDAPQGELLKPESLARLSDADRELLARLQAELVGGRSEPQTPAPNGSGGNGTGGNGAGSNSAGGNGSGAHALREPGSPHAGPGPNGSGGGNAVGGPNGASTGPITPVANGGAPVYGYAEGTRPAGQVGANGVGPTEPGPPDLAG